MVRSYTFRVQNLKSYKQLKVAKRDSVHYYICTYAKHECSMQHGHSVGKSLLFTFVSFYSCLYICHLRTTMFLTRYFTMAYNLLL